MIHLSLPLRYGLKVLRSQPVRTGIADAMGEIINIVAGGVKTRMAGSDKGFKLGLPMFIDGHVEPVKETEQAAHRVTLGSIRAYLLTLRQKRTV